MPWRKGTVKGTWRKVKQKLKNLVTTNPGYGEQLGLEEGMAEDGGAQQGTNAREIEGQKEEEEAAEEEEVVEEVRSGLKEGENQEQQGK